MVKNSMCHIGKALCAIVPSFNNYKCKEASILLFVEKIFKSLEMCVHIFRLAVVVDEFV